MIRPLDQLPVGVIGFAASGELSSEDYTRVLSPALTAATVNGGKLRVVLVFAGEFGGMEPGAIWQDLKMGVKDWHAWERIALVTDHRWMRDGLHMFAWAIPGEARAFTIAQRDDAISWAAS